jgi:arylsulfatase A
MERIRRLVLMGTVTLLGGIAAFPQHLHAADAKDTAEVAMAAEVAKPNIVFILADDMGYGDVSCYNPGGKIQTPNLDRLAAEGMRFTDAHSGGSSCIPSRYALMTGRFAVRENMGLSNGSLIKDGRMTIASLLRNNGYTTAMVGKWHLGFSPFLQNRKQPADYGKPLTGGPVDCGFDSFFGMHASLDLPPYFYIRGRTPTMPPTNDIEANDSTGSPAEWSRIQGAFWRQGKVAPDFDMDAVTPRLAEESVKIISAHAAGDGQKPLLLYLALPSPHTPWLPTEVFRGKSGAGMYGDFVLQVDDVVGQVMNALKVGGIDDNTLIVFTSDNGPVWYDKNSTRFGHQATGKLRGMKFASWEGGHRMPFIVRWPGKTPKGSICEQPIAFSDVFATFAEVVGMTSIPAGAAEDSISFLPFLTEAGKAVAKRPPIIHDRWTIRDGRWKLILQHKNGWTVYPSTALYDLNADISESRNLYDKYPEVVERLRQQLAAEVKR